MLNYRSLLVVVALIACSQVVLAQTGAPPPPVGVEFQANINTTGAQTAPDVAARVDGSFVVVWESDVSSQGSLGDDDDDWSVQVRRFALDRIFADGFEGGDTSAWSQTVP